MGVDELKQHVMSQPAWSHRSLLDHVEPNDLLANHSEGKWRLEIIVIPQYVHRFPGPNDRPILAIYHPPSECFLRYSAGPLQGFFWDAYGDNFLNAALALRAIMEAPRPSGKPYMEFSLKLPPVPAEAHQ